MVIITLMTIVPAFAQQEIVIAPQSLILSVQFGKPGEGGSIQEYRLKSGETAFIQTSGVEGSAKKPLNPQEKFEQDAYRVQIGNISTDISQKVQQIQAKQREVDTEVYFVQRAPLENEKRLLQDQLEALENTRTQIEAARTAREAFKPTPPPARMPVVTRGINVKPIIEEGRVLIEIRTQDQMQNTVETALGRWVPIFSSTSADGSEIWARIDLSLE